MSAPVKNGNGNGNGYAKMAGWSSAIIGAAVYTVIGVFWVGGIGAQVTAHKESLDALIKRFDKTEAQTPQIGQNEATISMLTERIRTLEGKADTNGINIATMQTKLTEIETQFCASDIVRNLMHANDMREIAVLYEKLYGQRKPTDNAFYPMICNRVMAQ